MFAADEDYTETNAYIHYKLLLPNPNFNFSSVSPTTLVAVMPYACVHWLCDPLGSVGCRGRAGGRASA
jgi:hypothetical protein